MAFRTIWSVDLGRSALKAVKLRRENNNVEILAIDKIDHPISANGVDDARKDALNIFRSRNEVKEPLVVTHPGQGTFSRFIKIPAFDAKKVQDMVQFEASQQIPFPLDEVTWDYHMVDREYLSGEEREVGLFAVRREAVDDFLLEFGEEGLSVEMMPIGFLSLFNFVKYDVDPQEPSIILDIGATHTDLILMDGERFWVRPLPHSGQEVTQAIADRFKLKFAEAERLKTEAARAPKQATAIFQAVIQPKLKELVQEIHRSIGFYRSQNGDTKFERLYLVGNGSRVIGIQRYMQDQLRIVVDRLQSIQHLRINREVNVKLLQSQLPAFGTAIGAGIQGLGLSTCTVDLVPKEEKIKKAAERQKKHVFIAAGILAAAMLVCFVMTNAKRSSIEAAIEDADALPTLISKEEKNVKALLAGGQQALADRRTEAVRIGELRRSPLQVLRHLEQVLSEIPNAERVDIAIGGGDEAAKNQAELDAKALLENKIWIPYLNIEQTEYPPVEKGQKKKKDAGVPAYRCELFAMVKMPAEEAQAFDAINQNLVKKLEAKLVESNLSVVTKVHQEQGKSDYPAVFFDPDREFTGGRGGPGDQDGRPFYGTRVTWFIVPRAPAVQETANAENS